jgi:hypothetical protein
MFCYTSMVHPSGWSLEISGESAEDVQRVALAVLQGVGTSLPPPPSDITYGDKYVVNGDVGSVGRDPFSQILTTWNQFVAGIDPEALASELRENRQSLRASADSLKADAALGALANAEEAVTQGDGSAVLAWLRRAGTRCIDLAQEIGATLAAEAIQRAIGLQ